MTLTQANAEVNAWTRDHAVQCRCGNNDLRSHVHSDPTTNEVTEICIYCPKCSEVIFKKTITVSEYNKAES